MLNPLDTVDRVAEFRPHYSHEQTQNLVRSISQNPHLYNEATLYSIKDHAAHYKIPFDPPEQVSMDPSENEFKLMRGLGEIGEGFLSGFSTFNVGEPSGNEYERILRSVGHLAGFVGYVPSMPLKAIKAYKLAEMARKLKGRSIPMATATMAQKAAKSIIKPTLTKAAAGRAGVTKTVSDFLLKDTPSHLAEGAFHLGLASAVGSWQYGIDEVLRSGAHGALTGAVFRGIGNIFQSGGVPKIDKRTGKKILDVDQRTDQAMRMLSSSLYEGLQSTYRGETTPEQVYSYLLGAFFGAHETSATANKKNKFMGKIEVTRRKDPKSMLLLDPQDKLPIDINDTIYDAKLVPGFDKLSPEVQKAVIEETRTRYGTWAENPTIAAKAIEDVGLEIGEFLEENEALELKELVKRAKQGVIDKADPEFIDEREQREFAKAPAIRSKLMARYGLDPTSDRDRNSFNKMITQGNRIPEKFRKLGFHSDPEVGVFRDFMMRKPGANFIEYTVRPAGAFKVRKIISGGQVGVDMFGLEVGKELGIETGGTAPPGYRQQMKGQPKVPEEVSKKLLLGYGLTEGESDPDIWPKRTEQNVLNSDGTVIFAATKKGRILSPGSALTVKLANKHGKAVIVNPTAKGLRDWIAEEGIETLNVAGNRRMHSKFVKPVLRDAILSPRTKVANVKIVTGTARTKSAARKNAGIYVMRPNPGDNLPIVNSREHFGNPWTSSRQVAKEQGVIFVDGRTQGERIEKAVKNYRAWLRGSDFKDVEQQRRKWILSQIYAGVLDGKNLLYFKAGYRSHADELADYINESVDPTLATKETREAIDPNLPEEIQDTQNGQTDRNTDNQLQNKTKSFVGTFFKNRYKDLSILQRLLKQKDDMDKIHDHLVKAVAQPMMSGFNELVKNVSKEFDISLGQDAKNRLRQIMRRRKFFLMPQNYSIVLNKPAGKGRGDAIIYELGLVRPETILGDSKGIIDAPKEFNARYIKVMDEYIRNGEITQSLVSETPWAVIDHFIMHKRDITGKIKMRNFDISQLESQTGEDVQRYTSQILENMYDNGYYYYGGKNDSGKMYFYRFHPEATRDRGQKTIKDILDKMGPIGKQKKSAKTLYKEFIDDFVKTYGGRGKMVANKARRYAEDAFASNMFWAVDLNGLKKGRTYEEGFKIIEDSLKGVTTPKDFNKRMQIWMTDGQEADVDFHRSHGMPLTKNREELVALTDGKLRFMMIDDAPGKHKDGSPLTAKDKAEFYQEATDGAILVREDYFDVINRDFGMPHSGQQKSFIVDPHPEYGALLGKFMFHRASKNASKFMRAQGIQMIIPRSSAKEVGDRKSTDIKISPKNLEGTAKNPLIYELNIPSIKGLLSEANTDHMSQDQSTPKQLMTNLTKWAFKEIPQSTIDEMFDEIVLPKFSGEEEWNTNLKDYLAKTPADVTQEELRVIIDNMDKVGLPELIKAVRNTEHHELVGELYQRILKVNADALAELAQEGEITNEEYHNAIGEAREFNSFLDRILSLHPHVSTFLYKDGRGYIQNAMRNFAVHTVTRPKQGNSLSVRMRPYDPWLRAEFPDMNKVAGDKIFMLDNIHQNRRIDLTEIQTPKPGREKNITTLGQAWKDYEAGGKKDKVLGDFFNALSLRVPMDSLSGAHDLKFAGFTGIDGHGGVFHPRTMKALGGADADGDKAFVFFGWPKKWREAYNANKDEFLTGEGKDARYKDAKGATIPDIGLRIITESPSTYDMDRGFRSMRMLKKMGLTYRDLLTITPRRDSKGQFPQEVSESQSFLAMFSPHHRLEMSNNAAAGRFQLGPAVVTRATLTSTYAAMKMAGVQRYRRLKDGKAISVAAYNALSKEAKAKFKEDRSDEVKVTFYNEKNRAWETRSVFIKPRDPSELKFARELMRAEIGFGSDPLDETGLSGRDNYFNWAFKSFFDVDMSEIPKNKRYEIQPNTHFRDAPTFSKMYNYNNAYYGKNWQEGRRHYLSEISDMAESINKLNPDQLNTFLPKMVNLLEPIDLEDDVLARYDKTRLLKRYSEFNKNLDEISEYSDVMGRPKRGWSSKLTKLSKWMVFRAMDKNLFKPDVRNAFAKTPEGFRALFKRSKNPDEPAGGYYGITDKDAMTYWPELISKERWTKWWNKMQKEVYPASARRGPKKRRFTDRQIARLQGLKFKNAEKVRRDYIERMVTKASDFVQNDQMDRTSMQMLLKYVKAYEETPGSTRDFIKHASRSAESIKALERAMRIHAEQQEYEVRYILRIADEGRRQEIRRLVSIDSTLPMGKLREKIDVIIKNFKQKNDFFPDERGLTKQEGDMFDAMLLSTYYRSVPEKYATKINELKALAESGQLGTNENNVLLDLIAHIESTASGTYFSKVGVNSPFVGDDVVRDYLETFSSEFESVKISKPEPGRAEELERQLGEEVPIPEGESYAPNIFEDATEGTRHLKNISELDEGARTIMNEFRDHLRFYQNSIGKDLNVLVRGMMAKNLDSMDLEDYRVLNRKFDDMRTGNWYLKNYGKFEKGIPILSKRHWMMFPRAVSEEHIIKDFILARQEGAFRNYVGDMAFGPTAKPTHYLERTQYVVGQMQALAIRQNDIEQEKLGKALRDKTGYQSIEEGHLIHEVAFMEREQPIIEALKQDDSLHPYMKKQRIQQYKDLMREAKERANWDVTETKEFFVQTSRGEGTEKLTGRQIADRIKDVYTEMAVKTYKWIRGKHYFFNESTQDWEQNPDPRQDPFHDYYHRDGNGEILFWDRAAKYTPRIDTKKFVNKMLEYIKEGKVVPMDFGLDGIRMLSRSIMLENEGLTPEYREQLANQTYEPPGFYHKETYNPHINADKGKAKKAIAMTIRHIESATGENWPEERKKEEIRRLVVDYHRLTGDYIIQDVVDWKMYSEILTDIAEGKTTDESKVMQFFGKNTVASSMHKRQSHIGGWGTDAGVWEAHQKNLIDTYYRQIGQILSRSMFNEFQEKYGPGGSREMPENLFRGWANFYTDYMLGSLGYPSEVPAEWLEGPKAALMNVKGTPYSWWADNKVADRLSSIKSKLGFKKHENLPEELAGVNMEDIRHWSNLEAKFEMAALLAHPKSAMGNLYGGTMHTIQSVGWRMWRNSYDLGYINTMIPKAGFENKEKLNDWVIRHGVIPEYIIYEAGIDPTFKGTRWKQFFGDAIKIIQKDPGVSDTTLKDVAKKYKITEGMYSKAAWFMREPERLLRRQAFVAHYLQARELYGHAGMHLDHPMLINLAKKGVQATQFLYSAPYRPAFSRTALGKVMTRFQTWAWNAVRFRREIIQEARRYGYREGTQEFERFKRLMTTDMFVFSLANVFAYSLFEAALPAPWSWLQDTADWIFGDDEERDRAFFGQWPKSLAPLQMITPPIARLPVASLRAFTDDDYSRLSGYYLWTMFPFGRIARDIKGIAENPMMTIEKMTGIPYLKFSKEARKYRPKDEVEAEEVEEEEK